MKVADFISEHKRLIKILETGTKKQRIQEAKGQAKELYKVLQKLKRK